MTRLLWSAVAMLVLIAIGAPCLTFYLLIKEYWAEVDSLRQELLYCQLGSSEFPSKNAFPLQSPFEGNSRNDPSLMEDFPPLPVPQRLTSHHSEREMAQNTLPAEGVPVSPGKSVTDTSSASSLLHLTNDLEFKDSAQHVKDPSHNFQLSSFVLATKAPSLRNTELENVMISDETDPQKTLVEDGKTICLSRDYVEKMEKRLVDLGARIEACRKCLHPPRQKESKCGGGPSWREYRRKERLARKEMREEKRRRRNKERKDKETETERISSEVSEVTSEFPVEHGTTFTEPQSDISSFLGSHSRDYQIHSTHNMRENHRASTDFRRGFNQKILRMDEALMQFTETQSAFCKELRDNLGGSLEKRGQELGALSEQIAALVRTTTSQVAMIEKLTSDQVYAGQTSIEKNLENLQTLRDDQVRSIQNFHKKTFLPAMVTLTSLLGEQASSVTNMGVDLITKVEMLQDFFLTFSTQQGDTLIKLSEAVNMFASKHGNLIMRSRDHAKHLHINTENFIRELQTRMNNVVKELVLVRLQSQSFISVNENTYHEISASLNKTEIIVDTLTDDLQRRIEKAKTEEGDFRKDFRQETDLISDRIESGISEVLMRNHAAVTQIGESELETRVFTNAGEAAWNEMYVNQEMELRQEADMLANNLRSHNHHTQNILTGLQGTAGTHEQVLEQQRMDFQGFIRKRQDALDTQCSSISDWAFLMSSELRRRDEDLHRFLSDELHLYPVTVQGVAEYDDFLVSRLPDGTLLYDSSPSDSFHSSGRSASNVTSRSREEASETTKVPSSVNSSMDQSSSPSPDNSLLPNSSRSNPPNPTQKALFISSQGEDGSEPPSSTPEEKEDGDETPLRGDVAGVKRSEETKVEIFSENDDALSNDIKVANEDQFDNTITHQNDQGVASNATKAVGCKSDAKSTSILNAKNGSSQKEDDDRKFKKLQEILQEAKKTILRFKKQFQVNENFRELKKTVWNKFIETGKRGQRKNRTSGHRFFNYTLLKSQRIKGIPPSTTADDVNNNKTNVNLTNTNNVNQTSDISSRKDHNRGLRKKSFKVVK